MTMDGAKRSPARHAAVLLTALAAGGCGTVFGGTTKQIVVASTPSEARLTTEPLTGTFTTPATLTLERKRSYTLVVWQQGYREAQLPVQRRMRVGVLILDILFGLVPVVVDAATGGWWDLQPDVATVELEPLEEAAAAGALPIRVSISTAVGSDDVTIDATAPVRVEVVRN